MRRLTDLIVAAVLLTMCAAAFGQTLEELEVDHALTSDFATPHTDWAQPYALGKTRVLFFTTGHNTEPRECVELMQRFDLAAQAVFYATIVDSPETHWHGAQVGERRMLGLLEQEWDCFVCMGGVGLDKFAAEPLYRLLRQVVDGAGLVLVGTDDPRVLKEKNRLTEPPPFLASEEVGEAHAVGQGRGLRLPARPAIGYYPGWEVDYDYWAERLGRAILWAAGKEPQVQLEIALDKTEFTREELLRGAGGFAWRLSGAEGLTGLRPEIRLRTPGRPPVEFATRQEALSDGERRCAIPPLAAGGWHADVRVLSPRGVEAWVSKPFHVTSAVRVTEVTLLDPSGEVGEHLAGSVTLEGTPGANHRLRVTLADRRGRELAAMALTGDDRRFDFPIEPWMPMLATVEATLFDGADDEVSSAYAYFRVTKRNRDRWNFLIWDTPTGTLAPYAEESLAKTGMTLQLRGGAPPDYVAAYDVAWVPYTTRILSQSRDEAGVMRPFCWNDEAAVQEHVVKLAQEYIPAREHGVFVYSLGDENDTLGACLSPHCAVAYRRFLQESYGSLGALNASWGTAFADWAEVGLSKADDNEEAASLQQGNYARWFDRQAYKSWNYVQYCRKYGEAYRTIDPESRTGFEGAGTFAGGDDLDLIARSLEFWSPYPGTADEVLRSLAPPGFPHANWMGYSKDASSLLGKFWRMVTRGMDAVWWWRWDCIGAFHGWLAPDLRPYPAVQEIIEDTQIVRDGLGDLLLKSEMQDDGIAVLYSYPSVFAHKLEHGAGYGAYESAHLSVHTMIRDLGLQFRYVTDRQLRLAEFDPERWKVLILPRADALGDKEAQVIRDFVEQGGTVIADVRPGLFDDHCRPRAGGVLDDLFGVTRQGSGEAKTARAALGSGAQAFAIERALVDPSVSLAGGTAAGEAEGVPLLISRDVGRGRAVLLNLPASSYPKLSATDAPEAAAALVQGLLAQARVTPAVRLTGANDLRARGVEVIRWRNGDQQIVALFREGGAGDERLTVALPQARHVHDLRQRRNLGERGRLSTQLVPNRANFLVLSTKAAPTPKLTLEPSSVARGEVVTATLSVPGAEGLHAFRVRANAGKHTLDWLDQNVLAGSKAATFAVPVALNDPTGKYQISAIDLVTNQPTTAELVVK
jgi:beta-galactosidase